LLTVQGCDDKYRQITLEITSNSKMRLFKKKWMVYNLNFAC